MGWPVAKRARAIDIAVAISRESRFGHAPAGSSLSENLSGVFVSNSDVAHLMDNSELTKLSTYLLWLQFSLPLRSSA